MTVSGSAAEPDKHSYRIVDDSGSYVEDEYSSPSTFSETKRLEAAGQGCISFADLYVGPDELVADARYLVDDGTGFRTLNKTEGVQRIGNVGSSPDTGGIPCAIIPFELNGADFTSYNPNNDFAEGQDGLWPVGSQTIESSEMRLSWLYNTIDALLNGSASYDELKTAWANTPSLKNMFAILNDVVATGARPNAPVLAGSWTGKCLNWDTGNSAGAPIEWKGLPMYTRGIDSNLFDTRTVKTMNRVTRFTGSRNCRVRNLLNNSDVLFRWADMSLFGSLVAKDPNAPWDINKPHTEFNGAHSTTDKFWLFCYWDASNNMWMPHPVQPFTTPKVKSSNDLTLRYGYDEFAHVEARPFEGSGWMLSETVLVDPFPEHRSATTPAPPNLEGGDEAFINLQVDTFDAYYDAWSSTILTELYERLNDSSGVGLSVPTLPSLHLRQLTPGYSTTGAHVWPLTYPIKFGADLVTAGQDLISRSGSEIFVQHILDRATGSYRKFAFDSSNRGIAPTWIGFSDPFVLGVYGLDASNALDRTDRGFFPMTIALTSELNAMDILMKCPGSVDSVGSAIRFTQSDGSLSTLGTPIPIARIYRDSDLTVSLYDGSSSRTDIPSVVQSVSIHATDVSLVTASAFAPRVAVTAFSLSPGGGLIGAGRITRS